MNARRLRQGMLVCALAVIVPGAPAGANGRMPGANDVMFDPSDPEHLVLRATFGVLQSFDRGQTWQWVCEQIIGTAGVIADPPMALVADRTIVLLPPNGGALLSRDRGCSWVDAPEPLPGERGADLTLDPNDPARLWVLTSTLDTIDASGFGTYRNLLIETRDSAASWQVLRELPSDFEAETVEVAKSDPSRLYVSGTASRNPRLGIIERSEDGGATWTRSELELPAGTGSLLISAIHPELPDRLWLRVPARGDTIGVLPARLYVSDDKGQSMRMLALTRRGMFGFALSPDATQLAYGGPGDGLFIGPADGSAEFRKASDLGVRCLRWPATDSLYACGTEPPNGSSLAVSRDGGASFEKLYALAETCPQTCAEDSPSARTCPDAWQLTQQQLGVAGPMCEAPPDAGMDAAVARDAGARKPSAPRSGCSCRIVSDPRVRTPGWATLAFAGWLLIRARARAKRFV